MRLPGRVPRCPCLGALAAGSVEGGLGCGEPVAGGVERFLGTLAGGVGIPSAASAAASLRRNSANCRIASRRPRAPYTSRNPAQAKSVVRPKAPEWKARPWTLEQVDAMAAALDWRYEALVYLGAGAGMRQGEMFGRAAGDVDFLRRVIHIRRQVRLVGNVLCFAPVKNDKAHDVPLSDSLAPVLAEHIRRCPPVAVTLPWRVPQGKPVTFSLVFTRPGNVVMNRTRFNESEWWPAQVKAGIVPARAAGEKRAPARDQGMHALRHTAASAWLGAGVSVAAVAAWLGDTEQTILATYAHLMPEDSDRGARRWMRFSRGVHRMCTRRVSSDAQPQVSVLSVHSRWK